MRKKLYVSIMIFINEVDDLGFKVWTQKRLEEGPLYGLWEFPGGKIEIGETPKEAVIREVDEEVGIKLPPLTPLKMFKIQSYSYESNKDQFRDIVLYVFICPCDLLLDQMPKDIGCWHLIEYASKSNYLEGKIPKINHVIIDELAVYLEKLKHANMMERLWAI